MYIESFTGKIKSRGRSIDSLYYSVRRLSMRAVYDAPCCTASRAYNPPRVRRRMGFYNECFITGGKWSNILVLPWKRGGGS